MLAQPCEIDNLLKQALERIVAKRIELIGRCKASKRAHQDVTGRMFETEIAIHLVNQGWLEDAVRRSGGYPLPEIPERAPRLFIATGCQTMGDQHGIDCAGAR